MKKQNLSVKIFSALMAVSLLLGIAPANVFADEWTFTATVKVAEGQTEYGSAHAEFAADYPGTATQWYIEATANPGYVFSEWQANGEQASTDNPFYPTLFADTEYIAVFKVKNDAPVLAEGVNTSANASTFIGEPYELDLSDIFTDADGDSLSYFVKKDGATEWTALESENYSYTPTEKGTTTHSFKANDGKEDSSEIYTVSLRCFLTENSTPTLASGVVSPLENETQINKEFCIDLSLYFNDLDSDPLTYEVSINNADYTAADASYTYTPTGMEPVSLKFRAHDGQVYSNDVYTVNITVKSPDHEKLWDSTNQAYMISSADDLRVFRNAIGDGYTFEDKKIYILNDITLTSADDVGSVGNVGQSETNLFNGTFDGRGHAINGWCKNEEALFLVIGAKGTVTNLCMSDVSLTQPGMCAPLAFYNLGTVSNCTVTGTISGSGGGYSGIVYSNLEQGVIKDCYSAVNISSTKSATSAKEAGITQSNGSGATVKNCIFTGILTIKKGKLYPVTYGGIVENCYYLNNNTSYKAVTGATGCDSDTLKAKATFSGFDFTNTWIIDADSNNGYPQLNYTFGPITCKQKVTFKVKVSVGDYTYISGVEQRDCRFPLTFTLEYSGKDKAIADDAENIISQYNCKLTLNEAKWKNAFAVKMPVNGVTQDFSTQNLSAFFDFTYTLNDTYEFLISSYEYEDAVGTYYDDPTLTVELTHTQKAALIKKAEQAVKTILDSIVAKFGAAEAMKNPFFVFTCARADYYPAGCDKTGMYWALSDVWKEYSAYRTSKGKKVETTETAKFVLAVTALGYDAKKFGDVNLIEELNNADDNGKYFASHYMAYALYSGRYGDYESIAKGLVDVVMQTSKVGNYNADDMATMYAQPLFLLYDKAATASDAYAYSVKLYVENEVFPWMQRSETGYAHFYSTFTNSSINVWTDAQAQILLGLLDADFLDTGYIKNGNTLIDYIIANPKLSLDYSGDESQCARALVALIRAYRGQTDLFDCSDVEKIEAPKEKTELKEPNKAAAGGTTKGISLTIGGVTYEVSRETKEAVEAIEKLLGGVTTTEPTNPTGQNTTNSGETYKPTYTDEEAEKILEAYKKYAALTDDEKLFVKNYPELEKMLTKLGEQYHCDSATGTDMRDNGESALPWHIKLVVKPTQVSGETGEKIKETLGEDAKITALFDLSFVDMLTGKEYHPSGLIKVKLPAGEYEEGMTLLVVHISDEGKLEIINTLVEGKYLVFDASGFSVYGVAQTSSTWEEIIPTSAASAKDNIWVWIILVGAVCILGAAFISRKKQRI